MLHGILNLHKPAGISSRKVVDQVERLVRPAKAGHAGTLDPLATGVLVVCVGSATRLIQYIQQMPKQYRAVFRLGCTSSTDDVEGDLSELVDAPRPSLAQLCDAAAQLTGVIEQRPPAFSALKVQGKRAYALARRGQEVHLAAREVSIYSFDVIRYEYPDVVAEVRCSSGTYVRALCRDLGKFLGTGAVMAALERSAIGRFTIDDAISPGLLHSENLEGYLRPSAEAVANLPRLVLSPGELADVAHGRQIARKIRDGSGEIAAFDAAGRLAAILTAKDVGGLSVVRYFPE